MKLMFKFDVDLVSPPCADSRLPVHFPLVWSEVVFGLGQTRET